MTQPTINLSYFLTTFGKLPYLKICLQELIDTRKPDEEIVIVEGGSRDGTAEWLADLHKEGKIQKFLSLQDFGESHGTNRALMLCEGTVLKLLTDDDIYQLEAIRECKEFMLQNEQFDMLGADGFDNYTDSDLSFISYLPQFREWMKTGAPFGFYGPGVMLRRSSIPLLGTFNTIVKFIDNEYTFRASCLPIKMAWYTKPMFVRVVNAQSNTLKFERIKEYEERVNDLYCQLSSKMAATSRRRHRFINQWKQKIYKAIYRQHQRKPDATDIIDTEAFYSKFKHMLEDRFQSSTDPAFIHA